MSVYNGGDFLKNSILSVLRQTFSNFEFIIVNDGSTDNSLSLIRSFSKKDHRIVVVDNHKNQGLTKSLNVGCKLAKGEYLARQDADDISQESRFEEQIRFLQKKSDVVLLGSRGYEVGLRRQIISRYFDEKTILKRIKVQNPFIHSSVMIKTNAFKKLDFYNENFSTSQDFDAWLRLSKVGRICMLDKVLVNYHINPHSISNKTKYKQCFNSIRIRWTHKDYIGYRNLITGSLYRCFMTIMPKFIIGIKHDLIGRK